jgi:CubicO group peptidase (beta-lactamase class C family)
MSATAIGHTGFTGTSLWIDWERDLYVVLLTNRVHPSREPNRLAAIRPAFHDAVMQALEGA